MPSLALPLMTSKCRHAELVSASVTVKREDPEINSG